MTVVVNEMFDGVVNSLYKAMLHKNLFVRRFGNEGDETAQLTQFQEESEAEDHKDAHEDRHIDGLKELEEVEAHLN